ncbi:MAG: VOC family protein [Acidobacteria bacterium]|nr:VOC family protein [Acidobacteriota bacterium]
MTIDHVAVWTGDLEQLVKFYCRYFGAETGEKYVNQAKGFASRFLQFEDGCRMEVMTSSTLSLTGAAAGAQRMGLTHLAFAAGSEEAVDELTARLRMEGHVVADGPRRTGDGCYESVVLDPDGNRVEITA